MDIITKLAIGDIITDTEIENELYAMCDRNHAECNDGCPVFKINGSKIPDTANDFKVNRGCDCYRNGNVMLEFIRSKKSVLSQRTAELISRGLKSQGLNENLDAYYYIEEELYVNEADEVRDFFKWLIATHRPYGPANSQQRWVEFKGAKYAELPEWYISYALKPVMLTKEQYEKSI